MRRKGFEDHETDLKRSQRHSLTEPKPWLLTQISWFSYSAIVQRRRSVCTPSSATAVSVMLIHTCGPDCVVRKWAAMWESWEGHPPASENHSQSSPCLRITHSHPPASENHSQSSLCLTVTQHHPPASENHWQSSPCLRTSLTVIPLLHTVTRCHPSASENHSQSSPCLRKPLEVREGAGYLIPSLRWLLNGHWFVSSMVPPTQTENSPGSLVRAPSPHGSL
jgi:hypothetical protein